MNRFKGVLRAFRLHRALHEDLIGDEYPSPWHFGRSYFCCFTGGCSYGPPAERLGRLGSHRETWRVCWKCRTSTAPDNPRARSVRPRLVWFANWDRRRFDRELEVIRAAAEAEQKALRKRIELGEKMSWHEGRSS